MLDIDAVDAALRLFNFNIDVGLVRVRPTPHRHAAFRGESSRLIPDMLREAGEPMNSRDIVLRIMEVRGINAADKPVAEMMLRVTGDAGPGSVASSEGRGNKVRRELGLGWHCATEISNCVDSLR